MRRVIVLFICITILSICSCTKKVDIEADIEAIKITHVEFDAALKAGDLDSWVSLFTEDAVQMPPNMPALVGKDAIRDFFQSFFEQKDFEGGGLIEEVVVCGDWAFVRGTYAFTITTKAGGEPIRDSGKWVAFNKRQPDGSWKYHRMIYNSDLPLSGVQ